MNLPWGRWFSLLLPILLFSGGTAPNARGKNLVVFCGFANQGVAEKIAAAFEEERGTGVELVFGTGGRLLAQMGLARRGDVFWPGSEEFIGFARRDGLLSEEPARTVAYHRPALFVPPGNPGRVASLSDLARPGLRVVIPNPEATAAGRAALELLEKNGLRDAVLENLTAFSATPPQAVGFAAAGSADAAISWEVYVRQFGRRVETVEIPSSLLPAPAAVSAAVTDFSSRPEAAREFVDYLLSPAAREILAAAGFFLPSAGAPLPAGELRHPRGEER